MNTVNTRFAKPANNTQFNQAHCAKPYTKLSHQPADAYFGSSENSSGGGFLGFMKRLFGSSPSPIEEPYEPANRTERQAILTEIYEDALAQEDKRSAYGFATVFAEEDDKALVLSIWHTNSIWVYDLNEDQWYSQDTSQSPFYSYPGLDKVKSNHVLENHQSAEEYFETTLVNMYELAQEEQK